jgi:hypothetical protein
VHDFIPEAVKEKRPARSTKAILFLHVLSCNAHLSVENPKEETTELLFACAIYEACPECIQPF